MLSASEAENLGRRPGAAVEGKELSRYESYYGNV